MLCHQSCWLFQEQEPTWRRRPATDKDRIRFLGGGCVFSVSLPKDRNIDLRGGRRPCPPGDNNRSWRGGDVHRIDPPTVDRNWSLRGRDVHSVDLPKVLELDLGVLSCEETLVEPGTGALVGSVTGSGAEEGSLRLETLLAKYFH